MLRVVVIDLQGVLLNHGFMVKELAIGDAERVNHYIFKPHVPYNRLDAGERRQVHWLEDNHHGLHYNNGSINSNEILNILNQFTRGVDLIYVKGHQKIEFLQKYLSIRINNLENYVNVPVFNKTNTNCCMYHRNVFNICSLYNLNVLMNYLRENKMI